MNTFFEDRATYGTIPEQYLGGNDYALVHADATSRTYFVLSITGVDIAVGKNGTLLELYGDCEREVHCNHGRFF